MPFGDPPVRTRLVIRIALGVQLVLTDLTFHDVILLVGAFGAPRTKVMTYQWAWPLVPVNLKVSWVKKEAAINAVLRDNLSRGAKAISALRRVTCHFGVFVLRRSPCGFHQRHVS